VDEIAEIDKEVRRLRERIFELNKRRIELKKLIKSAKTQGSASPETLAIPITSLRLSPRVENVLKYNDIHTLGEVIQHSRKDFLYGSRYRNTPIVATNFGAKSLAELEDVLLTFGLKFKGDE
jgi:DNA-directed RNA polymerase alpha subunit